MLKNNCRMFTKVEVDDSGGTEGGQDLAVARLSPTDGGRSYQSRAVFRGVGETRYLILKCRKNMGTEILWFTDFVVPVK